MAVPNVNANPGGRSIPSGYLVGRVSPGTGRQELISIADVARQMVALGVVPTPGAPASLATIADQRVLGNGSGGTAAPVALSIAQPSAGLTVTWGASAITLALADDLAALEGMASTGLVARTAAATYAQRTITGTADKITVTNGDGVAGNPTLTIAATYAGQASITTLGTIATGTWNATVIAGQYGGTGVANTGKTITLGGNLTTAGAFATTLTVTATTDATLPAGTQTLAAIGIAQTWTAQQTYTQSSSATGINSAAARLLFRNTDATSNNWVQIFSAQDSASETVGKLVWQIRDHTNHVGDAVLTARGSGDTNSKECVRVAVEGTTRRVGIGGGFATNAPQATLHVGDTAATARAYNSFTDASNGEWSYMGSWGVTANVATFGTGKNGTGSTRNIEVVVGGTRKLDYGIGAAATWTFVDTVSIPTLGVTGNATVTGTLTGTATGSLLPDQIDDRKVISTAQLDKTDNTYADIAGLTLTLVAGKTYVIEAWLSVTSGAAGGLKVRFNTGGGLSATSVRLNAIALNGTTIVSNTTVTGVAGALVASNAVFTDVYIKGSIVVNAGGTYRLQAAQNTTDATTTSVFAGSKLSITRIN